MSVIWQAREADALARLDASDTPALDASARTPVACDSVQGLRGLIKCMQAEIKFSQTRIEALNFEIARLKRWRFGTSAESLDSTTQAVLFDAILTDTAPVTAPVTAPDIALEDQAAKEANKPPPAAPRVKGRAVAPGMTCELATH